MAPIPTKEIRDARKEPFGHGVFRNHQDAESAVKELQKFGHDMKKLFVISKDYHTKENAIGQYNTRGHTILTGILPAMVV